MSYHDDDRDDFFDRFETPTLARIYLELGKILPEGVKSHRETELEEKRDDYENQVEDLEIEVQELKDDLKRTEAKLRAALIGPAEPASRTDLRKKARLLEDENVKLKQKLENLSWRNR